MWQLELRQNLKTQIVTKLKNANCEKLKKKYNIDKTKKINKINKKKKKNKEKLKKKNNQTLKKKKKKIFWIITNINAILSCSLPLRNYFKFFL